ENMFFNPQKYDFSRVGRLKLNTKLGLNTPLDEKILHPQDFYEVIKYLLKLRRNPANVDDIDHLGNRRVRSVGELLENQFRIGLISSLSCYARINEFGFIESPYRKVKDGRITDYVMVTNAGGNAKYKTGDIVESDDLVSDDGRPKKKGVEFEPYSFYLSAWEEDQYI